MATISGVVRRYAPAPADSRNCGRLAAILGIQRAAGCRRSREYPDAAQCLSCVRTLWIVTGRGTSGAASSRRAPNREGVIDRAGMAMVGGFGSCSDACVSAVVTGRGKEGWGEERGGGRGGEGEEGRRRGWGGAKSAHRQVATSTPGRSPLLLPGDGFLHPSGLSFGTYRSRLSRRGGEGKGGGGGGGRGGNRGGPCGGAKREGELDSFWGRPLCTFE